MSIVFFCQSCGARFEVPERIAGKKGHCKKCGQMMTIPRAEHLASRAAIPALAPAGAGAGSSTSAAPSIGGWMKGAALSAILAPITLDRAPVGSIRPGPLDGDDDSKVYELARPVRTSNGAVRAPVGAALGAWKRQVGVLQKIFRSLGEGAHLLSIPFIMVVLVGILVKSRNLALFGATFVVVLNIGRLAAGLAGLASVPLRSGLNTKKMKKPFLRVVEPATTIALIVAAFTFIPSLSSKTASKGTVAERLKANADQLRKEMKQEVRTVIDKAEDLDVESLGAQAREKLDKVGERVRGARDKP